MASEVVAFRGSIASLDAMIKDERQAGPAYIKLGNELASVADSPCKAEFIRILIEEHTRDENKHYHGLKRLRNILTGLVV